MKHSTTHPYSGACSYWIGYCCKFIILVTSSVNGLAYNSQPSRCSLVMWSTTSIICDQIACTTWYE